MTFAIVIFASALAIAEAAGPTKAQEQLQPQSAVTKSVREQAIVVDADGEVTPVTIRAAQHAASITPHKHGGREVATRMWLSTMEKWRSCSDSKMSNRTAEQFDQHYISKDWASGGKGALSGEGSDSSAVKPFAEFLLNFIKEKKITSMAEVSAGHWPSGWQAQIKWPPIEYHGVDIVPSVVQQDKKFLEEHKDKFGFASADFSVGDMACDDLPKADLLLTKDTLQHLSNDYISKFLAKNIHSEPRKYKYVMFVNDKLDLGEENVDIQNGGYRHLQMDQKPFNLDASTMFQWRTGVAQKKVQLLTF